MGFARLALLIIALPAMGGELHAQIVPYAFGSAVAPTIAATSAVANLSPSVFSAKRGSPATGSGNPLYSAGSGSGYFTASAWTGSAPGTNCFAFTLTPNSGYELSLSSISFGYRATGSGPTAFAVRSSSDTYASARTSGTIQNDSSWPSSGTLSITLSSLPPATALGVYGFGASSGLGTLRVDDVTLIGSVVAISEPATYAAILGAAALAGVMIPRQRLPPAA